MNTNGKRKEKKVKEGRSEVMEGQKGKKGSKEIMRKVEKLQIKGKERKGNRRRQASEQRMRKKE